MRVQQIRKPGPQSRGLQRVAGWMKSLLAAIPAVWQSSSTKPTKSRKNSGLTCSAYPQIMASSIIADCVEIDNMLAMRGHSM